MAWDFISFFLSSFSPYDSHLLLSFCSGFDLYQRTAAITDLRTGAERNPTRKPLPIALIT